ncbi:MAG TPA: hypothetical protein P5037_06055 [Candidatus Paceibacterota bacterium]|nr:hypothetical protein [Verrucomicrobiota bacterium]HRY58374.1 hypothetical protein [Candidatus Paceibacterota bacterium]HOW78504.1 hypothetical protein [Verrucomicrobiota bacterium]HQE89715.1 hypothetical protein [Verrucomicrobiota bacterium]HQH03108.1 hypothetical protein [Verrucomicrobiota bacterium]
MKRSLLLPLALLLAAMPSPPARSAPPPDAGGEGSPGQAPAARKARLLAHWKLTKDGRDASGNGNHGTPHAVRFATAEHRKSAQFDGRQSWLEVPPSPSLRLGTGDFTLAAWVRLPAEAEQDDVFGDIVSRFDPATRRGFNFRISLNAGVTTSQANARTVHFGIDDGRLEPHWTDHGRPGEAVLIFGLATHDGELYAATCEPEPGRAGRVYRFGGGTNWVDCGPPAPCNAVSALAEFQGALYSGVSRYRLAGSALPESPNTNAGGKVFRYRGGQAWEDCGPLPGSETVGGLVVYRGQLYASALYPPAGFFRFEGGRRWTALPTPGRRVLALCVYDGQLFASSYDEAHVFRFDGTGWTDCGQVGPLENTQTYSFAIYEGRLCVGTWKTGRVYGYRGDHNWEDLGRLGGELEVMGMLVHNGMLYAGSLPLAEVYRLDRPGNWRPVGRLDQTPKVTYRRAWTMSEFQGRLFCGTLPGGRVFSLEAGRNVTHDRALSPGWHHLAARRGGGRLALYLDGQRVAVSARFDSAPYDLALAQPLKIGFGPNDYFRGSLRDLRLYDAALTERRIAGLAR